MAVSDGKHRWIEKTPRHIRCIDRIMKWCPEAKIIIILRDGRDVACSIQGRTGSLEKGVTKWIQANQMGEHYWDHANVYVLKYEDIITDFKKTITGVLNFLGEDYEEGIKDYHKQERKWYSDIITKPVSIRGEDNHRQYRNWQINQPLFDGRGRWKKLPEEELNYIYERAGEMLIDYGYISKEDLCSQQLMIGSRAADL